MAGHQQRRFSAPRTLEPEPMAPAPTSSKLLVPMEETGVFAVFSDGDVGIDLDFGDFYEFPLMTENARSSLGKCFEQSITTANVGLQVARGTYEARGLVRLAPETLRLLQAGARTIQQGGWNIGSLSGPGGKILASVRWLPAGTPTIAIGVAANAAAGLALLALQWQLNRIEGLAEKNLQVSAEILQEIQAGQRNEVLAKVKRLSDAVSEAQAAGSVTNAVWNGFGGEGMETSLDALARSIEQRVNQQIGDLNRKTAAKERHEWMNERGIAFLQDLVTLIYACGGLYQYRALRVAHLLYAHPDDQAVAETVQQNAARDHQAMREKLAPRIAELWRHFSLMMECPGGLGATVWGRGKTLREVRDAATRMRDALGELHERFVGSRLVEPDAPPIDNETLVMVQIPPGVSWPHRRDPLILLFSSLMAEDWSGGVERLQAITSRLRWFLNPGETVKILARDALWPLSGPFQRTLIATTQRLFVLRLSDFNETGSIEEEIPNTHLCYDCEALFFNWRVNVRKVGSGDRIALYALDFPKSEWRKEGLQSTLDALREAREQQILARHPPSATTPGT